MQTLAATHTTTIEAASRIRFWTATMRKLFAAILILPFLFAGSQAITATDADAGARKKVKFVGKMFKKVERAGRKMSRQKGVVGKAGRLMRNTGRAGRKGTNAIGRGMSKGNRLVQRQLGKSKAGRQLLRVNKAYKRVRKNTLNRAFKRCQAQVCRDVKDGVNAWVPG